MSGLFKGIGAVIIVLVIAAAWLTNTAAGARWAYQRATPLVPGTLSVASIDGTLAGPLTIDALHYRDLDAGIELEVERLRVDLGLLALLRQTVVIESGNATGVRLTLSEPRVEQDDKPLSLDPPINVAINSFTLQGGVVRRAGEQLAQINTAQLEALWNHDALTIQKLDIDAIQGERNWIGNLTATAADAHVKATLNLQQPVVASLQATVQLQDQLTWEMELEIPRTDPRGALLADSSAVRNLAAALRGSGTRSGGQVSGHIDINAERLGIERLRVVPGSPTTTIDGLLRWGNGQMSIKGDVKTAAEPLLVDLNVSWRDLTLPADLAGQVLQSRGDIAVNGTTESYRVVGDIALGPPGRLADLDVALTGSMQAVEIERLALIQPQGRLEASGRVRWQPALGGQVQARLRKFEPRELVAQWRGGPVDGTVDLAVTADKLLTGSVDLRANGSRLEMASTRVALAAGDAMDIAADVTIPSLTAWLPDAAGNAAGKLTARGVWPKFDVTANIQAEELRGVGVELQAINARATGTVSDRGLSGSIETLRIAIDDIGAFELRQPARIEYLDRNGSLSQACLGNDTFDACLAGELQASGAARASYQVEHLPLALVLAFALESPPVSLQGAINGTGTVQRSATGELSGKAQLLSASGKVLPSSLSGPDVTPLLAYSGLTITGDFSGKTAQVALDATLDESGTLSGRLAATGIGEASTPLDGSLSADLPQLAVLSTLAPQLVDIRGSATLQAAIAGTLQSPDVSGQIDIRNFAANVPRLGLQLRNGELRVSGQVDGALLVVGRVTSGDGFVQVDGTTSLAGTTRIAVTGKDFLAADIPGVRVTATPDLVLQRNDEQLSLVGYVKLPRADIDLARLPRGTRPQAASDDVVIVDAVDRTSDTARSAPLSATIRVEFGEQVRLAGYGLDAKVDGTLMVRERPGVTTTGSGEVRVAGTYKAYGQALTIRQGQLLYAGTPLDNPRLTIVAARQIGTVTAGIRVAGSAKNPQLSVFSDPAMGEANALAYLVAGKPLEQIGAGEGDAMSAAARSLGAAAGGLLAKNIGNRLGIDEVGVSDNEMIGGAALTVGQYLSPRLYLSYGVGLFDPGRVLTLRYQLSDELSLKVEQGSERSRGGVEYRVEK